MIKVKERIYVLDNGANRNFTTKRGKNFYTKTIDIDSVENSIYRYNNSENSFLTGTDYEFLHNSSLIGYSNNDLKFYEFAFDAEKNVTKREMDIIEIAELFKDYEIIKVSDFSTLTNSIKIKKPRGTLKIILINDTDNNFENYTFTTNNSKISKYNLNGFVNIHKKGMIQFAPTDKCEISSWFIILVR